MQQPKSRNATKKELLITLLVVIFLIPAIIITKLYLKTIGILIISAAVLIYVWVSFAKMPKEEKRAVSEAMEKSNKTPLGKAVQFLQYLIYVLIAVALIRLFIG